MDRLRKVSIVLNLLGKLKESGSWCGETHIQKAMYFLQSGTGAPTGFDFIMYKHGPFSFDLRDELAAMRADGLVELKVNQYPYGPSLVVTDLGKALQSRFRKTLEQHEPNISMIAGALGPRKVVELERLATALYVTKELGIADASERAAKIHQMKPHVSLDQAEQAVHEMDEILSRQNMAA